MLEAARRGHGRGPPTAGTPGFPWASPAPRQRPLAPSPAFPSPALVVAAEMELGGLDPVVFDGPFQPEPARGCGILCSGSGTGGAGGGEETEAARPAQRGAFQTVSVLLLKVAQTDAGLCLGTMPSEGGCSVAARQQCSAPQLPSLNRGENRTGRRRELGLGPLEPCSRLLSPPGVPGGDRAAWPGMLRSQRCLWCCGGRARGRGQRRRAWALSPRALLGGNFRLNPRKNFFPLRVTEPWPRLPREAVESPSLEIFQPCLDKVLCSLLWVTLLRQEGWTG